MSGVLGGARCCYVGCALCCCYCYFLFPFVAVVVVLNLVVIVVLHVGVKVPSQECASSALLVSNPACKSQGIVQTRYKNVGLCAMFPWLPMPIEAIPFCAVLFETRVGSRSSNAP